MQLCKLLFMTEYIEQTNNLNDGIKYSFSLLSLLSNLRHYNKYQMSNSSTLKRINYIGLMNLLQEELSILEVYLKQTKPSKFCEISAKSRKLYYREFVPIVYIYSLPIILRIIKDIIEVRQNIQTNITTLIILIPTIYIAATIYKHTIIPILLKFANIIYNPNKTMNEYQEKLKLEHQIRRNILEIQHKIETLSI